MTVLLDRRALLAWLVAGPVLAGCGRDRALYRASLNPAGTPGDWDRGQGCGGPDGLHRGRRDRHGRNRQGGPYHRDSCPDYRSAGEGYPDGRGGSQPPPLSPPPGSQRPH